MQAFKRLKETLAIGCFALLAACGSDTGFKLDSESSVFQQNVTRTQVKVDILWVIDNSGSMENSQNNVADNFQAFIDQFLQTNFDFQMAVTTTDAYRADLVADPDEAFKLARFRDGTDATSYSGVKVITRDTPDLENTFITNILQGINGSGDERSLQSIRTALSMQENLDDNFPRQDALLAVIVLTDEADGSDMTPDPGNDPDWFQDKDYYDFLYNITGSQPDNLNFMFNTIGILDQACLNYLNTVETQFIGRGIAQRNIALSDMTGGYKGSLCDDFSDVMSGISDSIIEKSTAFKLDRQPALDTMVVTIDGVVIPMDPENGWTYDPDTMLVQFHGSAVPDADAVVFIEFDPAGLK
jgi:hypothetical protein